MIDSYASCHYGFGEPLLFMSEKSLSYYNAPLHRFMGVEFDARSYGFEYEMPVYYIMGENDWQTPYIAAQGYFEEISAPDKEFYFIPGAGHWVMLDNKTEFSRVLREEIKPRIPCRDYK